MRVFGIIGSGHGHRILRLDRHTCYPDAPVRHTDSGKTSLVPVAVDTSGDCTWSVARMEAYCSTIRILCLMVRGAIGPTRSNWYRSDTLGALHPTGAPVPADLVQICGRPRSCAEACPPPEAMNQTLGGITAGALNLPAFLASPPGTDVMRAGNS